MEVEGASDKRRAGHQSVSHHPEEYLTVPSYRVLDLHLAEVSATARADPGVILQFIDAAQTSLKLLA